MVCCLFCIHSFCAPEQSQVFIHKFNVVSKHNSPLNQSTGLLLSIPMDSEREEGDWVVFFFFSSFLLQVLLVLFIFLSQDTLFTPSDLSRHHRPQTTKMVNLLSTS